VIVGLVSLPFSILFGPLCVPVLLPGSLWLIVLGYRLWRPSERVALLLRRTHLATAALAVLLVVYGHLMLEGARRSAAAGGGLLGGFGLLPLALGLLLAATSGASLLLAWRAPPS
jgi:hypothetical protein